MKSNACILCLFTGFLLVSNVLFSDVATSHLEKQIKVLEYRLSGQDQELAFVKERLKSFETVVEAQEQEVSRLLTQAKDSIKKASSRGSEQASAQASAIEKLVLDLKAFKKQTNDLAQIVSELQKQSKEKDEVIANQATAIKELENALRLLASAMQSKTDASHTKAYEVKSGDTLDKIAKEHRTTVSAIKLENAMQKDKIFPGQKLQIP